MNCKAYTQKIATLTLLILALSMCLTTGMANALVPQDALSAAQQSESTPPVEQKAPAQVWTDKEDYHPGELVTIFGSGFIANTPVAVVVTKLKDNTTTSWSTGSDAQGNLTTTYQIDAQGAPLYSIEATDGTNTATNTFTDSTITYSTQWGTTGSGDKQFNSPRYLAVDADGNVYVTDTGNKRIQKFSSSGAYITQFTVSNPIFMGIAVDSTGKVYAIDYNNQKLEIFTSSGTHVSTLGGYGFGNNQFGCNTKD
jgi:hypothetical protein